MSFKIKLKNLYRRANYNRLDPEIQTAVAKAKTEKELKQATVKVDKAIQAKNSLNYVNKELTGLQKPKRQLTSKLTSQELSEHSRKLSEYNKTIPQSRISDRIYGVPATYGQLLKYDQAIDLAYGGDIEGAKKVLGIRKSIDLRSGTMVMGAKNVAKYVNVLSHKDRRHLDVSIREASKTGVKGFDKLFEQGGIDLIREFSKNGFTIIEWADSLREANVPNYKEIIAEKVKSVYVHLENDENRRLVSEFLSNMGMSVPTHKLG